MATYARPGEQRSFTLRDLSVGGVAVTATTVGATVTIGLYTVAGVEVVAPVSATALGDDWSVTMVMPVTPGTYTVVAVATVDYVSSTFTDEVTVLGRVPYGAVTRAELRRRVGMRLNDYKPVTLTSAGSTTVLIDDRSLRGDGGFYAGREVVAVGGTSGNLYQVRAVTGSSDTGTSLTLAPPLPYAPAVGDRYDLYNHRGVGWRVWEYDSAINEAIANLGVGGMERVSLDATLATDGTIVLPVDWTHVSGIDVRHDEGEGNDPALTAWVSTGMATTRGQRGFRLLPGTRTLDVRSGHGWNAAYGGDASDAVRVMGYRPPAALETDAEYTTIHAEWLVAQACANLLFAGSMRDPQSRRDAMYSVMQREAERHRPLAFRLTAANTVRIEA